MNLLIEYPVPFWIKAGFLLAIPLLPILTTLLVRSTFQQPDSARVSRRIGLFFLVYIGYVYLLGNAGFYKLAVFPPRVILLTTLPLALFLFIAVTRSDWYKKFIENVALDKLVQVHIFRLIGIFFLLLGYHDALPIWFSTIAGIGDVLTALTSLWIGALIRKQKHSFKAYTWIWNSIGLIDILFTAISANVLTKLSIDQGIMGVDTLTTFPFYFIPALAPPIIVFLHYSIYLKLKKIGTR